VSGLQRPTAIWADLTTLYWIAEQTPSQPGAVLAMSKDGGTPQTLSDGITRPVGLRVGATDPNVYFTADAVADAGAAPGLYKVPKTGGAVAAVSVPGDGRTFETLGIVNGLAFTVAAPANGGGASLRMTNVASGASCYIYTTAPGGTIPSLVADATSVYFIDSAQGAVLRSPQTCGGGATVFLAGQTGAVTVTEYNTNLFTLTPTQALRVDKSMPSTTQVVVAKSLPGAITMSQPSGYGGYIGCADGTVWHVLVPNLRMVASGLGDPASIDCDLMTGLGYAADRTGGRIVLLSPP
jgi:hypothetical protein